MVNSSNGSLPLSTLSTFSRSTVFVHEPTSIVATRPTYLVLPLIFQREIIWPKLAKLQPYLFGIGVAGISLFMMGAGTLGVPRRHWDITFSDANLNAPTGAGQTRFHNAGFALFPSPQLVLKLTWQKVMNEDPFGARSDSVLGGVGFFF